MHLILDWPASFPDVNANFNYIQSLHPESTAPCSYIQHAAVLQHKCLTMLKNPAIYSPCCTVQGHCYPNYASSTSPSSFPLQRARPSVKTPKPQNHRRYAQMHHKRDSDFRDNVNWSKAFSSTSTPTPYEIFELHKGAAYSKHKFYELVKIYHPDRYDHKEHPRCNKLSQSERLDRYRLIISAHEILSDPIKKHEYDKHGSGWITGHHNHHNARHTQGYYAKGSRKPFGTGKGQDNSPFANATWEDWERWYNRETSESPKRISATRHFHSNMLASLIIMLAVVSGAAQATRTGQQPGSLEERAQALSTETQNFLTTRLEGQKVGTSDSGGRIKWFLEKRDPFKYGLKEQEECIYKDHFQPPTPPPLEPSDRPGSGG